MLEGCRGGGKPQEALAFFLYFFRFEGTLCIYGLRLALIALTTDCSLSSRESVWQGGPSIISSASVEPVVWLQSEIAINPNATLMLMGLMALRRGFARLALLGPILPSVSKR